MEEEAPLAVLVRDNIVTNRAIVGRKVRAQRSFDKVLKVGSRRRGFDAIRADRQGEARLQGGPAWRRVEAREAPRHP